jgi:UMF1 family MFS transporter
MLFDLANTTFALGVGSRYFGLWVVEDRGGADWYLGVATVAAMLVVVFAAPLLGEASDQRGSRRPYLVGTTLTCVVATALLATGEIVPSLVLYAVAMVGFHLGTVVYDALLADVSTPETRGRVSGFGVAVGYGGSLLALGIGAVLLEPAGYAWVFRALAVAFLLFALPAFLLLRERPRLPAEGAVRLRLVAAPRLLVDSWRRAAAEPRVVRFLVGRFLYTDAINTLYLFNAIYVRLELGFSDRQTDLVALAGVLAAAVGAALSGRLVDRIGPRKVLLSALWALLVAIVLGVLANTAGEPRLGWGVAVIGGLALGATWSADRVWMTRISPPQRLGEFFGLYTTVGRFATVLGPLVWGVIADGLGLGRTAALASLVVFVIASQMVLRPVTDEPRTI